MKTKNALAHVLALLAPIALEAQQNPSLQSPQAKVQSPPVNVAPCGKQTLPPRKSGWLEKKAKALACKQNKNLCELPSSVEDATGEIPNAKPCPANPAPSSTATRPAISEKDKPAVPASPEAATSNRKTVYVCPPKSMLIPNFPYCVYADRSVVDAIPLPASLSTPAPPAFAAPASAQH